MQCKRIVTNLIQFHRNEFQQEVPLQLVDGQNTLHSDTVALVLPRER